MIATPRHARAFEVHERLLEHPPQASLLVLRHMDRVMRQRLDCYTQSGQGIRVDRWFDCYTQSCQAIRVDRGLIATPSHVRAFEAQTEV